MGWRAVAWPLGGRGRHSPLSQNSIIDDDSAEFALHPEAKRLLDGRRALVTGGASGIGRGICFELAAHGAAVAVTDVAGADGGEPTVKAITEGGGEAEHFPMDVTSEEQVADAFAAARKRFGGIDLLVNNAGIEKPFDLVDMPLEEWQKVLNVNLTGVFLCSREAARIMLDDECEGAIVNITSVHEQIPWKRFSHYGASKGGEKLFAQSIARELAPHGIRVVNVAPGAIATPINEDVLKNKAEREEVESEIPLGRWGQVSDVAPVVAWAASDEARYVVGDTIFVDGGMSLYPRFV